jgi:hypothetical protein
MTPDGWTENSVPKLTRVAQLDASVRRIVHDLTCMRVRPVSVEALITCRFVLEGHSSQLRVRFGHVGQIFRGFCRVR